ncbi:MAG: glycosyltransferase [Lacticaseibacillus paracasei]|jgi:glycosyltransferase involved in cell wall biosynthesis|nr:glycosyltransferase [Lacticaseibacillus paracasei]MCH4041635.1 glycosyltransferase [Lacticaseibacillus paracasei]MCH4118668.1 glycosyltransferase [Lacticaseibacillus paracasei]MCH4135805.1 glycosyltransferase [Lacticaseibacillus paracasei]MCH4145851.1 glycosyltransferase [Lacticaseibacillus paracasei]
MNQVNNPKVSVIIPAHNVEQYISDCIHSVLYGVYDNIELLLIENGSSDATGRKCDEAGQKDSRIRVFHIPPNGVSHARNFGIEKATGKYVCFVDADDLVSRLYVDHLVRCMRRGNVNVAIALPIVTFRDKQEVIDWGNEDSNIFFSGDSETALEKILLYKTAIGCYSKMFDRAFLIKNKIRFIEELFVGEGFNFNVTAFKLAGEIAMTTQKLYFYRVSNPNSAMTRVDINKLKNGILAIEFLNKTLNLRSDRINNAFQYAKWHTNFDFLMIILAGHIEQKDLTFFNNLVTESKKGAEISVKVPISLKEKFKAFGASFNPIIAGKIFNKLRKRKFSV